MCDMYVYTHRMYVFFLTPTDAHVIPSTLPFNVGDEFFLHGWTCQLNPIDIKCEMSFDLQALLLAPYLRVNAIHKNAFFLESNFD